MPRPNTNTHVYLLFSACLLFLVALGYGVAPAYVLPRLLGIRIDYRDLMQVFRALMGLYLALAAFWAVGASRPEFTGPAILSEVFVMTGLALGRLVSVILDGWPSPLFIGGMLLEFGLAAWGYAVWKKCCR